MDRKKLQSLYKNRDEKRSGKLRKKLFEKYGQKCTCCGETQEEFLTLEHCYGGGHWHQKQRGTYGVYLDAIESTDPDEYTILCYNCNMSRANRGYCPCKRSKT